MRRKKHKFKFINDGVFNNFEMILKFFRKILALAIFAGCNYCLIVFSLNRNWKKYSREDLNIFDDALYHLDKDLPNFLKNLKKSEKLLDGLLHYDTFKSTIINLLLEKFQEMELKISQLNSSDIEQSMIVGKEKGSQVIKRMSNSINEKIKILEEAKPKKVKKNMWDIEGNNPHTLFTFGNHKKLESNKNNEENNFKNF